MLHFDLDFIWRNQAVLYLIIRLVSGRVLVDVLGQLADEVPDQLHLLQEETNDYESSIVAELLHHQLRSTLKERKRKESKD